MTSVSLLILLYQQTGRGSDLGFYFMLLTLPGILFANPFGCLADKFDKKSLLVYADSSRALVLAFMAFFVPEHRIYMLLGLVFLSQIFRVLYDTSVIPLASDITHDEVRLAKATANLKVIFHASYILGLGLGGFISSYLAPRYVFMLDAATFIVSAALISSLTVEKKAPSGLKSLMAEIASPHYYRNWFKLIGDGVRMVWRNEYCKTIILLELVRDIAYGVLNPLQSFWPQLLFSSIKNSLGLSLGMIGVGCVIGGVFMNRYFSRMSAKKAFYSWCVVLSVGELLCALAAYSSSHFLLYSAGLLLSAACMSAFEVGTFVRYISSAKEGEKGAMSGFYQFVMRGSVFVGGGAYILLSGVLPANYMPLPALLLLATALGLLLMKKEAFLKA